MNRQLRMALCNFTIALSLTTAFVALVLCVPRP